MNKILTFLILTASVTANSQNLFVNKGGEIYTQKGASITVQGTFVNGDSTNGIIKNDGIIEIQGDFQNLPNATFSVNTDNTSTDRVVKFVGSGTQAIIGNMNTPGTASFYNLVVDKTTSTGAVQLQGDVAVEGSLVFGTTTTTTTYNPTSFLTSNNQKGLIQTYNGSTEYLLNVVNGNTDAIAGYPSMVMNAAPTTGYILTSGSRGSSNGGLQRKIATATAYEYPIGTATHGFNAVRMNFTSVPSGGGLVKGKFNDGSDNVSGSIGTLNQVCVGCTTQNPTPDNTGYNRFFANNTCNAGAAQWLILEDAVTNHGYWSFASANQNYSYSVEMFPNSYTMLGNITDTWRALKYTSAYGFNPTASSVNWSPYVDSVSNVSDLTEYSLNTGTCYTGNGVPGGVYSGFGQFSIKKSKSNNALPVTLISLAATPQSQAIVVKWTTAVEINNSGFNVERSNDGVNFNTVGWVAGNDNSTEMQFYTYNDNNVVAGTVYYYRLNQIDNNGNATKSFIVSAEITGATAFAISEPMPNPATVSSRINVHSSVSQDIKVKMYNMVGQLVSSQPYTVSAGDNNITFNVQSLASGSYSAVIETGEKNFSKILVVSK